jgi:quercetin dioxygenase-like cupin family protein
MVIQPFITYPSSPAEVLQVGDVVSKTYVNEPGQVSFGTIDYVPGWHISLHHHNVWELILIDGGSAGAGFVMFGGRWWRAEPCSAVFVPKNYPHAWSSGNEKGFKMLWVYGGTHQEADRAYDVNPEAFSCISREEERLAQVWTQDKSK